jgi:hypothetical protein
VSRPAATAVVLSLIAASFLMGRLTTTEWAGSLASRAKPAAAVREALTTGGSLARMARLVPALHALSEDEVDAVAAVYAREISTLGECDIAPFVDAWARIDAEQALEGTAAWPYAAKRKIGLRNALEAVTSREPDRGRTLYETLTESHPALRADLQIDLVSGWAAADPEGLRGYLRGLSKQEITESAGLALEMIARYHDVDTMLAWTDEFIEETPDAQLPTNFFKKAASIATRFDPLRATTWVGAHWGRDYAEAGPSAVAHAWILVAPLDAIAWLQTEAPAESRAKALESAFRRWLIEDRAAAMNWLGSEERTRFHDPAVAVHAHDLVRRSPEEAIGWCEQVLEPESREECFINVVRRWLMKDGAAAVAWLDESSLDEESRDSLRTWASEQPRRKRPGGKRARARSGSP